MKMTEVMDEIAARARAIPAIEGRMHAFPPGEISAPAGFLGYPTMNTHQTYGPGMQRWEIELFLCVGNPTDRAARERMSELVDGDGVAALITALESGDTDAFDVATLKTVTIQEVVLGAVTYLGAVCVLDIVGS